MLIKQKVQQAVEILNECSIDCWLTFVRESSISGEPTLPFLTLSDVTWHSAFIVTRSGKTCAIVGQLDKKSIEDLEVYDKVIGYVEGIKEPLLSEIREIDPNQIAVNYSKTSEVCDGLSHGMYLNLIDILKPENLHSKLISSESVISRLRARKTETELANIKAAIAHTLEIFELVTGFIEPGRTEKEIASFMLEEVDRRGLDLAWSRDHCPAVFTGPDTAGAHYSPTDRKVEPGHSIEYGLRS